MAAGESDEINRSDVADVSSVNDTLGNKIRRDQMVKPLCGVRINFVVIVQTRRNVAVGVPVGRRYLSLGQPVSSGPPVSRQQHRMIPQSTMTSM